MQTKEETPKTTSIALSFIITQSICIAIILISVLVAKFFFKSTYEDLKKWYRENLLSDTKVSEVIDFEI